MKDSNQFDVIIAGGGMVGLSLALALADSGLRLALVDQLPPPALADLPGADGAHEFDARVSALTPETVDLLKTLGVWPGIAALRVSPYQHMQVWDGDGTGAITFNADDIHLPCLGYIVENRVITAALAEAVSGQANVTCLYGQPLTGLQADDRGQRVSLADGSELTAPLLIGADGGRSRIREWAGFTTRSWSYEQQALVTTVKTVLPHQNTAWQCFLPSGPLAFLPLQVSGEMAQHYCSIVWSCDPLLASELLALPAEGFARRCTRAFESRLGAVELLAPVQAFPLQQLHAVDYVKPGLVLVGDAAHTIHPLAGQGVNLGFADVACLARVIQQAVTQGKNYASVQVLSRYQRERKPANLTMMAGMEGFKRLFGSEDLLVRYFRNSGLQITNKLSPIKHLIMRQAMGLKS